MEKATHDISRRSFLAGAGALALGGAAASLTSCGQAKDASEAPVADSNAQASKGTVTIGEKGAQHWSFMDAPEPIADEQIAEVIDCEILIVGAGISGVPATSYVADVMGADVICIEKQGTIVTTRPTGGNYFGTKKLKELGVLCTEEEKQKILFDVFGGANATSNQAIVKLWLDESGAVGDYIFDIVEASGIPVKVGGYYAYYKHFDTVHEGQEDMKKTGGVYSDSYWNMYALQHQFGESDKPGVALWGRPTSPTPTG